jgi:hypothetical protein
MRMNYGESFPASKLNELDPRKEVVSRSPFEQDDIDPTAAEHLSRYVSDRPREANRTVEPRRIESLQDAERKSFSPSPALRLVQEVEHPHAVSLARLVRGTPIDLPAADRIGRL